MTRITSARRPVASPRPAVAVVTRANFDERVKECLTQLASDELDAFAEIYGELLDCEMVSGSSFSPEFVTCRTNAVAQLKGKLESCTVFSEYLRLLNVLTGVLRDAKQLWVVIHEQLEPKLKVTLSQTQALVTSLFRPSELFELGIADLARGSLCDMSRIQNDEAIVDVFYAIAGFTLACKLAAGYRSVNPVFLSLVQRMIDEFVKLPDFEAARFVWLVESIGEHLPIEHAALALLAKGSLAGYVQTSRDRPWMILDKVCVATTSPLLREQVGSALAAMADALLARVVSEQKSIFERFIFAAAPAVSWDGSEGPVSDMVRAWFIYMTAIWQRMHERPELPPACFTAIAERSLVLFTPFYASIQPIGPVGAQMFRRDVMTIVRVITEHYPLELPPRLLQDMWTLLLCAAIVQLSDEEIAQIGRMDRAPTSNAPFLGLDVLGADFERPALAVGAFVTKLGMDTDTFAALGLNLRRNLATGIPVRASVSGALSAVRLHSESEG